MDLTSLIALWAMQNGDRAAVILHSSVLNYMPANAGDESWSELARELKRVQLLLPLDTLADWKLLSDSKLYGQRAKKLLRLVEPLMEQRSWLLGDLYRLPAPAGHAGEGCHKPRLCPEQLFGGKILALFCDLTAQEEFITHVSPGNNLYVQCNTFWDGRRCHECFKSLAEAKELIRAKPLWKSTGVENPKALTGGAELLLLRPTDGGQWTQKRVPRKNLTSTGQGGGFCNIFRSGSGTLYRLYKGPHGRGDSGCINGTAYSKLRYLCRIGQTGCFSTVALPKELIRRPDVGLDVKECIGYTMDPLPGKPLSVYLGKANSLYVLFGSNAGAFAHFYRSLARTLLELQMLHIHMNDLSYNNVLVDQQGNAYLVDTDSFALGFDSKHTAYGLCGGDITPAFRHPEIGTGEGRQRMLLPKHLNFSFAILLYQALVNADVACTLYRKGEETTAQNFNWRDMRFPLEPGGVSDGAAASRQLLQNWRAVPGPLRGMLADVLHHRRVLSLGLWVELCDSV